MCVCACVCVCVCVCGMNADVCGADRRPRSHHRRQVINVEPVGCCCYSMNK